MILFFCVTWNKWNPSNTPHKKTKKQRDLAAATTWFTITETEPTPYRPSSEEEDAPAPPSRQPAYVYAVAELEQPLVVEQPFVPSPISTIDAVLWGPQEEDQQVLQEYVPVRQEEEVSVEKAQVPFVVDEEAPIQDGSLLLSVEQELSQEPEYQEPIRQVEPEFFQSVYEEPIKVQPQQPVETFQVQQDEPEEPTVQEPIQIEQQEEYIEPVQTQELEQTYQISQEYLPPVQVYQQQPEPEIQQEVVPVQPQYQSVKAVQQEAEVVPEIVQQYVEPVQVVETIQQEPEFIEEVQQAYIEPVQAVQQPEQTYQIEQEYVEPVQIPEQPIVIQDELEQPIVIQEEPEQSYQVEQEIEQQPIQIQEEPEQSNKVEQEIQKQASSTFQEPLEQQFNFQQTIEDFAKKQTVENLSPVLSANKQAGRGRPIRPRPIIFQRTEEDLFQQGFPEVAAPEGDDVPLDEQAAIREAIFELKKESRTG